MSLSTDVSSHRRKRTATDRAKNNGDPLVAKKRARQAAQPTTDQVSPTAPPAAKQGNSIGVGFKKGPNVSLHNLEA